MTTQRPYELVRVSPSMIRSVFDELKANGYSDHQILALSDGLMRLVDSRLRKKVSRVPTNSKPAEESESEEFAACSAGLPRQL